MQQHDLALPPSPRVEVAFNLKEPRTQSSVLQRLAVATSECDGRLKMTATKIHKLETIFKAAVNGTVGLHVDGSQHGGE